MYYSFQIFYSLSSLLNILLPYIVIFSSLSQTLTFPTLYSPFYSKFQNSSTLLIKDSTFQWVIALTKAYSPIDHANSIPIIMDNFKLRNSQGKSPLNFMAMVFSGRATCSTSLEQLNVGPFYYLLPTGKKVGHRDASQTGVVTKNFANRSGLHVLAPLKRGVWKVKIAIGSKELEEILSEKLNTKALIEQMSMAAKSTTPTKSYWGQNLRPILTVLRTP